MFQRGFLTIGRWQGTPIRLHWTLPLGALVFGQFKWVPAFWLGFFLLVFVHELGHAIVIRRCRQHVVSIDIHGLGGWCRWAGIVTPIQRAMIAWGGVWAQIVLLLGTLATLALFGPAETAFELQMAYVLTRTNLFIMALNLLPIPPLDGAEAWPLVPLVYRRIRYQRAVQKRERAKKATEHEVERLKTLDDQDEPLTPEVKAVVDDLFARLNSQAAIKPPPSDQNRKKASKLVNKSRIDEQTTSHYSQLVCPVHGDHPVFEVAPDGSVEERVCCNILLEMLRNQQKKEYEP